MVEDVWCVDDLVEGEQRHDDLPVICNWDFLVIVFELGVVLEEESCGYFDGVPHLGDSYILHD